MKTRPGETEEPHLNCKVCLKEIPRSVAQSLEGPDYVYYFCGADCYEKWRKEAEKNNNGNRAGTA